MQTDEHLLTVLRYVEANPLRPTLAARAQDWPWSSVTVQKELAARLLSEWPVQRPGNWLSLLNRPQREADVAAVRLSIARDRPLGSQAWVEKMAARMGLEFTLRPRGRPRKSPMARST